MNMQERPKDQRPLTTLAAIKKSSRDPNRGLYPNGNKRKRRNCDSFEETEQSSSTAACQDQQKGFPGFQKASSLEKDPRTIEYCDSTGILGRKLMKQAPTRQSSHVSRPQSNTLLNYFAQMKRSVEPAAVSSFRPSKVHAIETKSEKADSDEDVDDLADFSSSIVATLPPIVLESIFCQLPCYDLCHNASRVCRLWNDVISYSLFMPWKKKYARIKNGDERTMSEIDEILTRNGFDVVSNCLFGLIRFMVKEFDCLVRFDVLDRLRCHPKYSWAVDLANERIQGCVRDGVPSVICVVTILCIIADSVRDASLVLSMLIQSSCPAKDSIDCLYCIATFLFVFKQKGYTGMGFHYRVYHALFLYENDCNVCVGDLTFLTQNVIGQQNILKYGSDTSKLRFSGEQLRVINHEMRPRDTLKIVAFAGTGKTTTLVQFARMRPNMTFLHVAYNKSVSEHARNLFPPNVVCRTIHSLAYQAEAARYRHKLRFKLYPLDVMDLVKFPHNKMMGSSYALKTLYNFMNSADDDITIDHVPNPLSNVAEVNEKFDSNARTMVAGDATRIWRRMIDPNDGDVKIVHDTYLKLYQLKKPKLQQYDCILVDEAQDCNAAMIDIIQNQDCCKILVGDPHQQIYGFRGAIDSLNFIKATCTYYLTQSFRFGPKIAYMASCFLDSMKKVQNKLVVGSDIEGGYDGQVEGQEAVIARSNNFLFNEVIRICLANPSIQASFAGGLNSYNFDQILDIYNLMQVNKDGNVACIKDKFIGRFKSFGHLQTYAQNVEDQELIGKIRIVNTYRCKIPQYIELIKSRCNFAMEFASVVFSTAHKAKGLEFTTVRLLEDFLQGGLVYSFNTGTIEYKQNLGTKYPDDEANVLYVALTRAKKRLVMSSAVTLVLLAANESFESIVSSPKLQPGDKMKCANCSLSTGVPTSVLSLKRELIQFRNRQLQIAGGPLCCVCATKSWFNPGTFIDIVSPFPNLINRTHEALNDFVGPTTEELKERIQPPPHNERNRWDMAYAEQDSTIAIHFN